VLKLMQSKYSRQEKIKAFDRAQLSMFIETTLGTCGRLYPLFFTMSRTGLRIGEAMALQWDDLDFNKREIRIERAVSNNGVISTPKSDHGRTVDMSTLVRDVLPCRGAGWRPTGRYSAKSRR